jgi:hypothetical protein
MLRRLTFSLAETENADIREAFGIGRGYGSPRDGNIEGQIVLASGHWSNAAWHSVEGAREWVLEQLRSQGVELRDAA